MGCILSVVEHGHCHKEGAGRGKVHLEQDAGDIPSGSPCILIVFFSVLFIIF